MADAEFEIEREPLDHDEWFADGDDAFVCVPSARRNFEIAC